MSWTPTERDAIKARKNLSLYSKRVRKAMALDRCEMLAHRLYVGAERDADELDTYTMRLLYNIRTAVEEIAYEFGVDFYDIWMDARMMCADQLRWALPRDKYENVRPYHYDDGVGIEFTATLEWTHKKARKRAKATA